MTQSIFQFVSLYQLGFVAVVVAYSILESHGLCVAILLTDNFITIPMLTRK